MMNEALIKGEVSQNEATGESGTKVRYLLAVTGAAKDAETDSAKTQLRNHIDEVNAMDPVADINYTVINKAKAEQDALELYNRSGRKIDRQDFGTIELSEKELKLSSNYLNTSAEFAAWMTIPRVLKRGKIISGHADHKGEGFPTYTIAAPVIINGKRGNVAVVVMQTARYRYKMHRILMPDGSKFVYENYKSNAEPTSSDVAYKDISKGPDIGSASNTSIAQKSEKSTPSAKRSHNLIEDAEQAGREAAERAASLTRAF